jgi:hypothetical protein
LLTLIIWGWQEFGSFKEKTLKLSNDFSKLYDYSQPIPIQKVGKASLEQNKTNDEENAGL